MRRVAPTALVHLSSGTQTAGARDFTQSSRPLSVCT